MTRLFALVFLIAVLAEAHAASLSDAFSEGTQFGRSGNAAARSRIDSGTAGATVPGFTNTAPAASYFGGPGLGTPSAAALTDCATVPAQSQGLQDQACQAINFSQTNPGRHPIFTIAPNNPVLTRSRSITADPASIAGTLTGTYSACTTQTVTSPDIYETRICNEYRTLDRLTCEKTLSVSVVDSGLSCNYGDYLTANPRIMFIRPFVFVGAICADDIRFMWIYGYSECNGTNAAIYVPTIVPTDSYTRMSVDLGCGGVYYLAGSCPGGNCSYEVGLPEDEDRPETPLAGFAFQRPHRNYTVTDSWDNQCATLESRLP